MGPPSSDHARWTYAVSPHRDPHPARWIGRPARVRSSPGAASDGDTDGRHQWCTRGGQDRGDCTACGGRIPTARRRQAPSQAPRKQKPRHHGRGLRATCSRAAYAVSVTAVSGLNCSAGATPTAGAPVEHGRPAPCFACPWQAVATGSAGGLTGLGPGSLPWQGQSRRSARRKRCQRWSMRRIPWSCLLSGLTVPLAQCLLLTDRSASKGTFHGVLPMDRLHLPGDRRH